MSFIKNKLSVLEMFEKHAASKSEARRVVNCLLRSIDDRMTLEDAIMLMSVNELMSIRGIGRRAIMLIMEVACDLAGKK